MTRYLNYRTCVRNLKLRGCLFYRKVPAGAISLKNPQKSVDVNPKEPRFFWSVKYVPEARHLGEGSLEPPNFHFCQQTVYHIKAGIFN